jgi:catechol 2,3-dioxygenase-like lactoylglutathione lyase family enzyme
MLETKSAVATVAVKDLDVARRFYEGVLGLTPNEPQQPGSVSYKTGGTSLFVYASRFAGTNQATSVTWLVRNNLEKIVGALREKGVTFEHYDLPNLTLNGDIHVSGSHQIAWFKDSDGNIHSLSSS